MLHVKIEELDSIGHNLLPHVIAHATLFLP